MRNLVCNFGLHRIFCYIYPSGIISLDFTNEDSLIVKYIFMLIFWFFGIFIIFMLIYFENKYLILYSSGDCKYYFFWCYSFTHRISFIHIFSNYFYMFDYSFYFN